MNSIRTTWLAVSRSGNKVCAFDSPARLQAFIDESALKGVKLLRAKETTIMQLLEAEPCEGKVVSLAGRRGK